MQEEVELWGGEWVMYCGEVGMGDVLWRGRNGWG